MSADSADDCSDAIPNSDVAIIGMSGRFPGAKNLDEFWSNLKNGVESITVFSDDELLAAGVPLNLINNPDYVKVSPILADLDKFDAFFFDYSAKEALFMDPQQRIFLECAWQALESAGYATGNHENIIGIYGGATLSIYLLNNILNNNQNYPWHLTSAKEAMIFGGNVPEALTTRTAYKLNLTGPAVHISTACSTSLVTVHTACQSLLNGECEIALAGGVSYLGSQKSGYLREEGMILSADGHCRSFDEKATGTLWGNGVGIVVLKLLDEAIADGDYIHAVIKSSAINNDGNQKVSHSAPSVDAQASVIYQAQELADIDPETISYIEAHGTATPLGDPIEIAALTQAFRAGTEKNEYCAIGSLKSNIGHLSEAAGIAGLIKTILALKHKQIPPSLHFDKPNPEIDFANSPFYVNTQLKEWKNNGNLRRAGVSSFGLGGTNAHIIVEEWSCPPASSTPLNQENQHQQLLLLSTKTASSLKTATINLAKHLQSYPKLNLKDVAYTLALGRKAFDHRHIALASDLENATNTLKETPVLSNPDEVKKRSIVFMFPGQGSQYANMARELYQSETVFQQQVDKCCDLLQPHLGLDLREIIYPTAEKVTEANEQLKQTSFTQTALFVIEYALAQQWMAWGIKPTALIGHSIGEYVAATLANVFKLEDALALVAARGILMQSMPGGSMLAVLLPSSEVSHLLIGTSLEIATQNSPKNCVISGTTKEITAFEQALIQKGIPTTRLHTSHAFHSRMMEPILQAFTDKVKQIKLNTPSIPFVSNLTGTWIKPEEATDPNYYAQQLRSCVRFSEGIKQFFDDPDQILLEVGPGRTLSTLVKRHPDKPQNQITQSSMRTHQEKTSDVTFLLKTLGQLWLAGTEIDWNSFYGKTKNHRITLPTYPFEHKSYWIEPNQLASTPIYDQKKQDIENWFYQPSWKRANLPRTDLSLTNDDSDELQVLIFIDEYGYGAELIKQLAATTEHIIAVKTATTFAKLDHNLYSINPDNPEHYQSLIEALHTINIIPQRIVHLWGITENIISELSLDTIATKQNLGFYSLLYLAQALGQQNIDNDIEILVVTNQLQNITGEEIIAPEKATLIGAVRVIPQEYNNIHCRNIDIATGRLDKSEIMTQVITELNQKDNEQFIAYRGNTRWLETYEPVPLAQTSPKSLLLKRKGVYFITGGMGGMGLVFAEYLAKTLKAKLILCGRSAIPNRNNWTQWLTTHTEEDPTSNKIKKIQQFEQWGAQVLVVRADVTNLQQMAKALAKGQQRFNHINGVIHTAGVPGGGVIQIKTKEIAQRVLAPKVEGTIILDTLFKDIALDFMILCSSMEAHLGTAGQIDYCAANNFLDAYAHSKSTDPKRLTLSINWDAWQKVGMAVETAKYGLENKILEVKKLEHHLFEQCIIEKTQKSYVSKLRPDTHWIIGEHMVLNTPSLVGTAYLEFARAAYECHSGQSTMELQDVYFLKFLFVESDEEKEVRTILKLKEDEIEFTIQSLDNDSGEWSENARGKIVPLDNPEQVKYNIIELEENCDKQAIVPDLQALPDYTHYGSRWLNNIKWRKSSDDKNLALMVLPQEFHDDLKHYKFHPSLVDTATYVVADVLPNELTNKLSFFSETSAYLPYFYEKVRIKGPLPATFYSSTTRTLQKRNWSINLSFIDTQGIELVTIENYILKYIDSAYTLKDDQKSTKVKKRQLPKKDQSFAAAILPEEGIDCLERILYSRISHIIVSTINFETHLNLLKINESKKTSEPVELFERPQLNEAYFAPQSKTELAIAQVWERVIGIKDIGTNDNFFDLGGDSLIMVQILNELRKDVQSNLTMNALLSANTIAQLALIIDPSKKEEFETTNKLPACVIKFRDGSSDIPPLFLIHPIAGNTYNYINLPSCLQSEQAIYAIQHPEWAGESYNFKTIEEIATYYLQAILQVQSEGPYHLCGFSGGVYITYEIAQQITQMGNEVEFLALVDKPHWLKETDKPNWKNPDFGSDVETFVFYTDIRTPKANGESHLNDYLKLDNFDDQLRYFIKNSPWLQGMMPEGTTHEGWLQFWRVFVQLRKMNVNYELKPYHGQAVYFAAEIRDIYTNTFTEQPWFQLIPKLTLEIVPGDHVTMWHQPNVEVLAQRMEKYFNHYKQSKVGGIPKSSESPKLAKPPKLTKEFLFDAAYKKTGLSDFGDCRFQAGLTKLLESINKEAKLHSTGKNLIQQLILRLLVNRLNMQDDFKRHPEILETPIEQPLFIVGLPRTGSTYLHNLLAQDLSNRWLHLWEAFTPSPSPDPLTVVTDPRIKKTQESFAAYEKFSPESSAMHKYDACSPEECLWLLQHDFTCISFNFLAELPSYAQWIKTQDMVPVYQYYRQQLQLLSWKWRTNRWVLKNPFHTADLSALKTVFPDARFIHLHRDPLEVTASYSRLIEKLRPAYSNKSTRQTIGKEVQDMLSYQIKQGMEALENIPQSQICNIQFDQLVNDPKATVKQIYEYFGYEFTQEMKHNLNQYIDENPRYKHGKYSYSLQQFGLEPSRVKDIFKKYFAKYGNLL